MDWAEKARLAKEALEGAKFTTRRGWARANCPFCPGLVGKEDRKQAFAVHSAAGWFKCWRCGTTGRIPGMGDSDDLDWESADAPMPSVAQPPPGFYELAGEPGASAAVLAPARDYLRRRGVEPGTWAAAGVGACATGKQANRIIIPIMSSDLSAWVGWVAREWADGGRRPYVNHDGMILADLLLNHAALLRESDDPLLAVEGPFDTLFHWPEASGFLGKPKEAQVLALAAARRPVAVMLDGDAWEEGMMIALRLRFEGQRAGFVKLPPKTDPDQVDRGWVREEARRCIERGI